MREVFLEKGIAGHRKRAAKWQPVFCEAVKNKPFIGCWYKSLAMNQKSTLSS